MPLYLLFSTLILNSIIEKLFPKEVGRGRANAIASKVDLIARIEHPWKLYIAAQSDHCLTLLMSILRVYIIVLLVSVLLRVELVKSTWSLKLHLQCFQLILATHTLILRVKKTFFFCFMDPTSLPNWSFQMIS